MNRIYLSNRSATVSSTSYIVLNDIQSSKRPFDMRYFEPWSPINYREGIAGKKILVLGESHYGSSENKRRTFTNEIVQKLAIEKKHRYFSSIQRIIMGLNGKNPLRKSSREWFWHRVAFYNFVQDFPGTKARQRPSRDLWRAGKEALAETLQELSPDFVLVTGIELNKQAREQLRAYQTCVIPHPASFGFSLKKWKPVVTEALRNVN